MGKRRWWYLKSLCDSSDSVASSWSVIITGYWLYTLEELSLAYGLLQVLFSLTHLLTSTFVVTDYSLVHCLQNIVRFAEQLRERE